MGSVVNHETVVADGRTMLDQISRERARTMLAAAWKTRSTRIKPPMRTRWLLGSMKNRTGAVLVCRSPAARAVTAPSLSTAVRNSARFAALAQSG